MLNFSVMLEDDAIERALLASRQARGLPCRRVLTIASGGDTALAVRCAHPQLEEVVGLDLNPAQLEHARAKASAIERGQLAALNLGDDADTGLAQQGACAALFRDYRRALRQRVAPGDQLARALDPQEPLAARDALVTAWMSDPEWIPLHEALYGPERFARTFGPQATQHAHAATYAAHVRRALERGLRRADAPHNPWLQHIFLGLMREQDAPAHWVAGRALDVRWVCGGLEAAGPLSRYDVLSLSNIFDWSPWAQVRRDVDRLIAQVRPGAQLIIRQLYSELALEELLRGAFTLDRAQAAQRLAQDRSLLYTTLIIATRR